MRELIFPFALGCAFALGFLIGKGIRDKRMDRMEQWLKELSKNQPSGVLPKEDDERTRN